MPRYNYECEECGFIEEKNVFSSDSKETIFCKKCGGKMKRLFSPQGQNFLIRWGKPKVRQKVKRMGA